MVVIRKKIFRKDIGSMEMLLSVLEALGLNSTFFLQFVIFIGVYLVLNKVLFVPYFNAFIERSKQTEGNHDWAERLIQETVELEGSYQKKARSLNDRYRSIYDASRSEAMRKHDEMVQEARAQAKSHLEKSRQAINSEVEQVRVELKEEIPSVSQSIVNQLLNSGVKQQ